MMNILRQVMKKALVILMNGLSSNIIHKTIVVGNIRGNIELISFFIEFFFFWRKLSLVSFSSFEPAKIFEEKLRAIRNVFTQVGGRGES